MDMRPIERRDCFMINLIFLRSAQHEKLNFFDISTVIARPVRLIDITEGTSVVFQQLAGISLVPIIASHFATYQHPDFQ